MRRMSNKFSQELNTLNIKIWQYYNPVFKDILLLKNVFLSQRTPLHAAASQGYEYTVKSLVANRANIDIQDKAGVSWEYNTGGM